MGGVAADLLIMRVEPVAEHGNERAAALIPVFRDWLDAHNQKVGGHTPHGGYDMNNGWIMEDAWLKS